MNIHRPVVENGLCAVIASNWRRLTVDSNQPRDDGEAGNFFVVAAVPAASCLS